MTAKRYSAASIRIWALLTAFFSAEGLCQAITYDEIRKNRARSDFESFKKSRRELASSEYFLLSLSREIASAEVQRSILAAEAKITAVHTCHSGGGITAFFVDPNLPIAAQLSKIELTLFPESRGNAKSFAAAARPDLNQPIKLEEQSGQVLYCGVELKVSINQLERLEAAFASNLAAIEITHERQRKLPINSRQ